MLCIKLCDGMAQRLLQVWAVNRYSTNTLRDTHIYREVHAHSERDTHKQ